MLHVCSSSQKPGIFAHINVVLSPIVFQYFCIPVSPDSIGIAYIGSDWKAKTLVNSMSPISFMCYDVRPHHGHNILEEVRNLD